jgi:phosphoenolpyruvate carboxylase
MEQEKQLLASLLAYNQIPFGDYKNYVTTDRAVDLFVQGTPKQEIDKMFVSAGLPVPKDEYQASQIFQRIYNEISNVDETSYSGTYRQEKEEEQLHNLLNSLQENPHTIQVGGNGVDMPNSGNGFSNI